MRKTSLFNKIAGITAFLSVLIPSTLVFADNTPNPTVTPIPTVTPVPTPTTTPTPGNRQHWIYGVVTVASSTTLTVKASNAAIYAVDISNATLKRAFGAKMLSTDFQVNDHVKIKGAVSGTNVTASTVWDLSLQAKHGTFYGTVQLVGSPTSTSFTLQSSRRSLQTINTGNNTKFLYNGQATYNGSPVTFANLAANTTVRVNGVWDRTNSNVTAVSVNIIVRMVPIRISGTFTALNGNSMSITGSDSVVYTVDISKARLVNKQFQTISSSAFNTNDNVQFRGRHAFGSASVSAYWVRDLSVSNVASAGGTATTSNTTGTTH